MKNGKIGDFCILLKSLKYLNLESSKKILVISNLIPDEIGIKKQKIGNIDFFKLDKYNKFTLDIKTKYLLNLNYSRYLEHDLIIRKIKADIKVCFFGDIKNSSRLIRWISSKIYKVIYKDLFDANFHDSKINKFMLSKYFKFHEQEVNETYKFSHGGFCIIAPGAGSKNRYMQKKTLKKIIEYLLNSYSGDIYITGTEKEGNFFSDSLNKNTKNLFNKIDLKDFSKLIKDADFIISTDSGPSHLASLLNKRAYVILDCLGCNILKGGDYRRFFPYPRLSNPEYPECYYQNKTCFRCDYRLNDFAHDKISKNLIKAPVEILLNMIRENERKKNNKRFF